MWMGNLHILVTLTEVKREAGCRGTSGLPTRRRHHSHVSPSPAVTALCSQRRLQPTLAAFAEQIFGQLNVPVRLHFASLICRSYKVAFVPFSWFMLASARGSCSDDGTRGCFRKCCHSSIGVFSQILYASSMNEESKTTFS